MRIDELPLSADGRRLIGDAREETRLDHDFVGTAHLVLAMSRQPEEAARELGHADVGVPHIVVGALR